MTDLHTHILSGMDDGSPDIETSLKMLRMEMAQGVTAVALTPHFYPERECIAEFLLRRKYSVDCLQAAISALPIEEQMKIPKLILGAEVAWSPRIEQWPEIDSICYGNSRYILLELPFYPWSEQLIHQLYSFMEKTGLTPVIAHIDRYLKGFNAHYIEDILSIGIPIQISAEELLHPFSRRKALRLMQNDNCCYLISDCHDCDERPPNLGNGLEVVGRKLGDSILQSVQYCTDNLIV